MRLNRGRKDDIERVKGGREERSKRKTACEGKKRKREREKGKVGKDIDSEGVKGNKGRKNRDAERKRRGERENGTVQESEGG